MAPSSASGRHRYARRREPSRLRGWALATAAIAAATGTVPLALSTLAREEPPMPRIGTFPVAAPADLGLGTAPAGGGYGSGSADTSGPDLAATLPPPEAPAAPVVVPTAQNRPLPPATRRATARSFADDERPERPPRSATTRPTTTTRTTPTPTPDPDGEEPREDPGSETPTPRETTTTTTTSREPTADRKASADDGDDRESSVLGSAVGTVRGVGGGLLG